MFVLSGRACRVAVQLLDLHDERIPAPDRASIALSLGTLRRGPSGYTLNTVATKHLFFGRCENMSFYVPRSHPDGFSVNASCLDPGSIESLQITPFNDRERDVCNWLVHE